LSKQRRIILTEGNVSKELFLVVEQVKPLNKILKLISLNILQFELLMSWPALVLSVSPRTDCYSCVSKKGYSTYFFSSLNGNISAIPTMPIETQHMTRILTIDGKFAATSGGNIPSLSAFALVGFTS
jgi:hypothetical protein